MKWFSVFFDDDDECFLEDAFPEMALSQENTWVTSLSASTNTTATYSSINGTIVYPYASGNTNWGGA